MAMWVRRYQLHPMAVLSGSAMVMFGGAYFPHIYPGDLSVLDTMAWVPLILLTVDELIDDPQPKWVLIGIFALTMELLAGHPQTVFNTLITCLLYGALRLKDAPRIFPTILAVAVIGIGAAAIGAMQLWTGLQTEVEGTRHGGLPFAFAAMFSFPPENFITLMVPSFFGNLTQVPYWGRCYLWEMSLFFGLSGLSLAIFGAGFTTPRRTVWLAMVAILLLIAVGNHTPLFAILFRFVPGFDHFRSHSKFALRPRCSWPCSPRLAPIV